MVEAFLGQVAVEGEMWIGRGQCIEHYGAGEGYMPVLEALGRLCRAPGGGRLIELLGQHAPAWLVQMPALLSAAKRKRVQREVQGATRERMLREMAEAVEALTAEHGQEKEGIQQILHTLPEYETIGVRLLLPYFFALLAEAYEKVGKVEEALTVLAEAFTTMHKTGER